MTSSRSAAAQTNLENAVGRKDNACNMHMSEVFAKQTERLSTVK